MKIPSRCPTTDKHSHVQTGSCTGDLLALVEFCDLVWVLISHLATLQTGLFCLLVPISQWRKTQTQITKPYQKYDLSPLVSFFKAAEMRGGPTATTSLVPVSGLEMRSEAAFPGSIQVNELPEQGVAQHLRAKRSGGG